MTKAKVYFSKEISPEIVVKMYEKLGIELPGKVAVKVHSGEKGNQNFQHRLRQQVQQRCPRLYRIPPPADRVPRLEQIF